MSLCISTLLPSVLPLSLFLRVAVEPGSMEYSAVIHPLPVPVRCFAVASSTVAVHMTLVLPISMSTDPWGLITLDRVFPLFLQA